jgi:6-phosphogluconate dehydrogenase
MGVSGCGKTTIGKLLAQELKVPFFDGDDFHSPANIEKMSKGNPLNDV